MAELANSSAVAAGRDIMAHSDRAAVGDSGSSGDRTAVANTNSASADPIKTDLSLIYACTDVGNQERFVAHNKQDLRFVPERKGWVIWEGNCYQPADAAEIFERAKETARNIYAEADACPNRHGQKVLREWAMSSQGKNCLERMIASATKAPELVAHQSAFDDNPYRITCRNGVVDLRTGELIKADPSMLVMQSANVAYRPDAQCPIFHHFLNEICCHDKELKRWLQRALGYALYGLNDEQVFFIAYGTGANGKSTLFEVIKEILSDYARAADFKMFLASDQSTARGKEDIGRLRGIRFALASETDSTKRFSEATIKKVTGGDTLIGAVLYGNSFEFMPQFTLWMLANHLPAVKDASHGFWRRAKVIPFKRRFGADEIDQSMNEKLLGEAEGIFAWLVRGAAKWWTEREKHGSGLGSCRAVDEAVNEYRQDNDSFGRFIAERLERVENGWARAGELYDAYLDWSRSGNEQHHCSHSNFASRMMERGFEKKRRSQGYVYLGVNLRTGWWDDDEEEVSAVLSSVSSPPRRRADI